MSQQSDENPNVSEDAESGHIADAEPDEQDTMGEPGEEEDVPEQPDQEDQGS